MKIEKVIGSFLLSLLFLSLPLKIEAATALTLKEAIRLSLKNNPEILISQDNLKMANLSLKLTEKNFLSPEINLTLNPFNLINIQGEKKKTETEIELGGEVKSSKGCEIKTNYKGNYDYHKEKYTSYYSLQIKQVLFRDSKLTPAYLQLYKAKIAEEEAKLDLKWKEKEVILSTVKNFLYLQEMEDSLNLTKEKIKQEQLKLEKIKKMVEKGFAGDLDLLEIKIKLEEDKEKLHNLEDESNLKRCEFFHSLGLEKNISLPLTHPQILKDKLKKETKKLVKEEFNKKIILQNIEVEKAYHKVDEENLQLKTAKRDLHPDLSLTVGYTSKKVPPEEFEPAEWRAGLNLTYKLFDSGKRKISEKIAYESLKEAKRELEETKDSVETNIYSKKNELKKAISQLELLDLKREKEELELKLKNRQFISGIISKEELRDFQIEEKEIENSYQQALHNLLISYLSYRESLGIELNINEVILK